MDISKNNQILFIDPRPIQFLNHQTNIQEAMTTTDNPTLDLYTGNQIKTLEHLCSNKTLITALVVIHRIITLDTTATATLNLLKINIIRLQFRPSVMIKKYTMQ